MGDFEFTISRDDIRLLQLMKRRAFYQECVLNPLEAALDWQNERGFEPGLSDEDRRRVRMLTEEVCRILKRIDDEIRALGTDPDDLERLHNDPG